MNTTLRFHQISKVKQIMETNRLQRKVKPYGGAMIALGWVGKGITDAGRSKQGRLVE